MLQETEKVAPPADTSPSLSTFDARQTQRNEPTIRHIKFANVVEQTIESMTAVLREATYEWHYHQ